MNWRMKSFRVQGLTDREEMAVSARCDTGTLCTVSVGLRKSYPEVKASEVVPQAMFFSAFCYYSLFSYKKSIEMKILLPKAGHWNQYLHFPKLAIIHNNALLLPSSALCLGAGHKEAHGSPFSDRNVVTAEEALLQTWKEVMLHKNLDRPALCFHSHSVSVRSHFLLKSVLH